MNFSPRLTSWLGLLLLALILLFGIVVKWQQEREAARASLALYTAQQRQKIADEGKSGKLVLNNIANKVLKLICGVIRSGKPYIKTYTSQKI